MHTEYNSSTMKQLRDQQVRFAPRDKKLEQMERAEQLIVEIDPLRVYSCDYLCFRITKYRPEQSPNLTVSGTEARHDLRLFVEDVSDSADIRVEDVSEPVHTVEQLGKMLNVSTKTISRWREQGLVSRRFIVDGRKRVGFLHSSVERFVNRNLDRVKRGKRFSQLTEQERDEIVDRARRLARAGGNLSEITRQVANQMNRSVETIRYTLKQFDKKQPDLAIFPNHSGPLKDEAKHQIYQQYRRGEPIEVIAKQYNRARSAVYRVVNEVRATRIAELPLDFMHNEEFERRQASKSILTPMPQVETQRKTKPPGDLPHYLASLYDVPLLTREQEYHLFRKFNFLKYQASQLRDQLNSKKPKTKIMGEIEPLYEQVVETKNIIVQSNLRLVVSIAKRHVSATDDFFTLVSDGNMSLIRAVEKFDYSRGNKFSTYASWAIMKNFARTIPVEFKYRDRFRTSQEELFGAKEDRRSDQWELERDQQLRTAQVNRILACLDDREQQIIVSRYGLDYSQEPQTLKQVGAEMGVTKERVRQIEARALNKLRQAAKESDMELPSELQ
ncbi:MAG TPA: sigma-70 family RNA polymerase sigma factor [Planctomycetaceae bacterium]|nr:sigma-70 family RNA polymerase sigma factor [Planctomycetaceae bacterium]